MFIGKYSRYQVSVYRTIGPLVYDSQEVVCGTRTYRLNVTASYAQMVHSLFDKNTIASQAVLFGM